VTIHWVGSPKFTAGHPALLIALVHHRMVGTLRSTDAAFTRSDGREASTHFGELVAIQREMARGCLGGLNRSAGRSRCGTWPR
jgi:hypothetical protein